MTARQTHAGVLLALLSLAKPRIMVMVLVACSLGFVLASRREISVQFERFFWTLLGTALLSCGASALNCFMERKSDALMKRTCTRPLPAKVISPSAAFLFGVALVGAGSVLLFARVNQLAGILGLMAVLVYLVLYTPAKRLTWLNTPIGAIPGAIPPLIGWASARDQIDTGGWNLFFILFLWQHAHFFPIAWLHREDYRYAGFRMLPVLEKHNGQKTFLLTILSACGLVLATILLHETGIAGCAFNVCSLSSALLLIAASLLLYARPSHQTARNVLIIGLLYLPVILTGAVADRYATTFTALLYRWWRLACSWT